MRTLQDAIRAGMALQFTCEGCGRTAVYNAIGFLGYLKGNPAALALSTLERRAVCEGDGAGAPYGCGHKGARIVVIEWPPSGSGAPRPKPQAETPPLGVDAEDWARADAREKKRLVRLTRG